MIFPAYLFQLRNENFQKIYSASEGIECKTAAVNLILNIKEFFVLPLEQSAMEYTLH